LETNGNQVGSRIESPGFAQGTIAILSHRVQGLAGKVRQVPWPALGNGVSLN